MSAYGMVDGVCAQRAAYIVSGRATNINFLSGQSGAGNSGNYNMVKVYSAPSAMGGPVASNLAASKDSLERLKEMEAEAAELKKAIDSLRAKSANNNDVDATMEKTSEFAEKYNRLLESRENISSKSLQSSLNRLAGITKANEMGLEKIGLEVASDNKLHFNKLAFRQGNVEEMLAFFHQNGGFAHQIEAQAGMLGYMAKNEMLKANTYNKSGRYTNNNNYLYENYV